jgi:hypothetical protein
VGAHFVTSPELRSSGLFFQATGPIESAYVVAVGRFAAPNAAAEIGPRGLPETSPCIGFIPDLG